MPASRFIHCAAVGRAGLWLGGIWVLRLLIPWGKVVQLVNLVVRLSRSERVVRVEGLLLAIRWVLGRKWGRVLTLLLSLRVVG